MLELGEFIDRIHRSPGQVVLTTTGGGSGAIGALCCAPGASQTVLEALVPYSAASLVQFLGSPPEQFCGARTARAMAMQSWRRAQQWAGHPTEDGPIDRLVGLAASCSLRSLRPKRGPHRVHVAVQTAGYTRTVSLVLVKGARSRPEEEELAARIILNGLAAACEIDERLELMLESGEQLETDHTDSTPELRSLMLGRIDASCLGAMPPAKRGAERLVFPGAFNPLHAAHRQMAVIAEELRGVPVEFEISVDNVDKPTLDYTEIAQRARQFSERQPLWLTRAATFVEKSAIFPGSTFVVGADTIARIADSRYYRAPQSVESAVREIAERGCRFLVFGRKTEKGFQSLESLALPSELVAISTPIPADRFQLDISSTQLRKLQQQGIRQP